MISFLVVFILSIWVAVVFCDNPIVWNITALTNNAIILRDAVGKASIGKMHGIMGPSGSGKTTLLNILADVVPKGSLDLIGYVKKPRHFNHIFVGQDDLLFPQLTTDETVKISASLKANKGNKTRCNEVADKIILKLGLKKVKDTPVGDAKTRGLSGGEKKRLHIATELVEAGDDKILIFADEPTSGLDSFQAHNVIEILHSLTVSDGHTVIVSIHQPRTSIFNLLDEITLLSEGRVIFSGPVDDLIPYFTKLSYPCPSLINPAEYYIDLISVDYTSPDKEVETKQRIESLAQHYLSSVRDTLGDEPLSGSETAANSVMDKSSQAQRSLIRHSFMSPVKRIFSRLKRLSHEFKVLFKRAWIQVTRDKPLNIARLMSSLFSSLLFGAIYFQLSNSAKTVPDRLGLLQVAAVNTAMLALIKATTSFVSEKLIIQRERRTGMYSVLPYFASKLLAEVPLSAIFPCISGFIMYKLCRLNPAKGRLLKFLGILVLESMASSSLGMSIGSLAPTVDAGIAIAPSVMVIFIVFGGLYVVNTPSYLRWVPKMSLIRWAYEALSLNEFSGLVLEPAAKTGLLSVTSGEEVLQSMGYGESTIKHAVLSQIGIILVNYIFTFVSLSLQKPSFQKITETRVTSKSEEVISRPNGAIDASMKLKKIKKVELKLPTKLPHAQW